MSSLSLPGFAPPPSAALSQYDTPRWIAERMVQWAGVTAGLRVLEPSAGLGALAEPLRKAGADVTCCEIDPVRVSWLESKGFNVVAGDFLAKMFAPHDLAVLNPPYENGQDLEHILRALTIAPRVVVLAPLGLLDGVERHRSLWSKYALTGLAVLVRRFKAPGSEMGGQRPFAVFEIRRGQSAPVVRPEWWA